MKSKKAVSSQYVLITRNRWSKADSLPKDLSSDIDFNKIDLSKYKLIDPEKLLKHLKKD